LKVLDVSSIQGAYCGALLGQLGADVLKIEPLRGDDGRRLGPFLRDSPDIEHSLFHLFMNTDKRGMTLNLESYSGRRIFEQMAERADVVIQGEPSSRFAALGIGPEQLRELNPRLIVTSITPYGLGGPYRDFVATDLTLMGMAGALYDYGMPDGPPTRLPGNQSVILAGLHAANATIIALLARNKSGRGQVVDVSAQDAAATAATTAVLAYDRRGAITTRTGTARMFPGMGVYEAAEGHTYWVLGGRHWDSAIRWMSEAGLAEDLTDPVWAEVIEQMTNQRTVLALLGASTEARNKALQQFAHIEDVFTRFVRAQSLARIIEGAVKFRVPVLPLQLVEQVANDPHLAERGFWTELKVGPERQSFKTPSPSFRLHGSPASIRRPAPLLGEHTVDVLRDEAGLSVDEIAALCAEGTI